MTAKNAKIAKESAKRPQASSPVPGEMNVCGALGDLGELGGSKLRLRPVIGG